MIGVGVNVQNHSGASLPYAPHPDLYAWDFTQRSLNGTKIVRVPEMARGTSHAFEQTVAASQPVADINGALFSAGTVESMAGVSPVPFNGSAGVYVADLIYMDPASTGALADFIQVYNDTSGWPERFTYGTHFAGQIIFNGSSTDVGSPPVRGLTSAGVTKAAWHVIEMQWDLNSAVTIWVDQVQVPLTTADPGTDANLQPGNSSGLIMGGQFHGARRASAIFDGVIPTATRLSVSNWLMGIRP